MTPCPQCPPSRQGLEDPSGRSSTSQRSQPGVPRHVVSAQSQLGLIQHGPANVHRCSTFHQLSPIPTSNSSSRPHGTPEPFAPIHRAAARLDCVYSQSQPAHLAFQLQDAPQKPSIQGCGEPYRLRRLVKTIVGQIPIEDPHGQ